MAPSAADDIITREKLLIRVWLPGVGCRDFRSPRMSDAEARGVIGALKTALDEKHLVVNSERPKAEKDLACDVGRVFCQVQMEPDPNCPDRSVILARCLFHADGLVPPGLPDRVCAIPLPRSETEARRQGWEHIGKEAILPRTSPESQPTSRRISRVMAVALILALAGSVVWWRWPSIQPVTITTQPSPPRTGPSQPDRDWKEARQEIREVLRQDWAKRLSKQNNSDNLSDVDLLIFFTKLFRRPSIPVESGFDQAQRESYEQITRAGSPHPFLDFLKRLPAHMPVIEPGDRVLTWAEASAHLQLIVEQFPPGVIAADVGQPASLIQEMKLALNYRHFFEGWQRQYGKEGNETLWSEHLDEVRPYKWQPPVRKFLRENYPH